VDWTLSPTRPTFKTINTPVAVWITNSNRTLGYNWIGQCHPIMIINLHTGLDAVIHISYHIILQKKTTMNVYRAIVLAIQCRRTPAVVYTHIIHLSKEAVPEKAQSWTNKTKHSKTLPKEWSDLFKFQTSFHNLYQHPCGVQQNRKKHTSWIN
jgi:hypothetical protein